MSRLGRDRVKRNLSGGEQLRINNIARRIRNPDAKFIGFDSFEGLPERWGPFVPGHFSTGGTAPSPIDGRISFVKGWFQNTLPGFLASHKIDDPVLVHFDADLYSSTLFLMTTLWHHTRDYYFLFDEFIPAEIVAMYDFARAYPVEYEFTACVVDEQARPLQILGHIRNTALRPQIVPPPLGGG